MLDTTKALEAGWRKAREYVDRNVSALGKKLSALGDRIADLEARQPERGPRGEDGAPGRDGKDADLNDVLRCVHEQVTSQVATAIKGLPVPKDGRDGRDGQTIQGPPGRDGDDGLGFDDMNIEFDGERTITLAFVRGDRFKSKSVTFPIVLDRGVHKPNQLYEPGDGVTCKGSYWIAKKPTTTKPGDDTSAWRLAVRRGRDGKDAHNA
ncbi:phage portal protein [Hyphomicrobium sp. 1Nfss2.1]|uniref:hypothetical protein n=1 Tax=Hyphomicrobium sp. 1Nfss2.1 TaxID=3413936 RepID=UPI003C7D2267